MPYDKDLDLWVPFESIYKYEHPKKSLIEVTDLYTVKKFDTLTVKMELFYIYGDEKRVESLEVSNDTLYDMYKSGYDNEAISFWMFNQLVKSAVDSISTNEYVRQMATNIFLAFYAKKNNQPVDTNLQYSIGDPVVYASAAVHKSTLDYMKILSESVSGNSNSPSEMAKKLPGMQYVTECPATYGDYDNCSGSYRRGTSLYYLIQHLNDDHKWTREGQIADWLDKLHDDGKVDLSFKMPDD